MNVGHSHAQRLRSHARQRRNGLRDGSAVFVRFAGGVGSTPCVHGQRREREFEFGDSQHVQGSGLSSKGAAWQKLMRNKPHLVQGRSQVTDAALHVVQFFQTEETDAEGHEVGRLVALQRHPGGGLQSQR